MSILLTTLNARYAHCALGLRYLIANMGALQPQTELMEFVTGADLTVVAEKILLRKPVIVGISIYIWNVEETTKLVSLIKAISPDTIIILGGPEVSHETDGQLIVKLADYVIRGWGEVTLPLLCRQILNGNKPSQKIQQGIQPHLSDIVLPYAFYSSEDIAHRTLYVEASRGCPFRCEFCLSSLDKTAWTFETDVFLDEMEKLYRRGARNFKFVDRTFNLGVNRSLRIIRFFLKKLEDSPDDPVFAHFELVPDHLPDVLKEAIAQFPPGSLQLEIGVQTYNTTVQSLISRKQDNKTAENNIRWLREHSHAHLHADLIVGLPGEDIDSFARGFNRLVNVNPHEIQVGVLKRLRGTPVLRHIGTHQLVFDPGAPYTILSTADISFADMQRMKRFARYWDLIANSGRFIRTLPHILKDLPFERFMALSDWIYQKTGAMHSIALERLAALITEWLSDNGEEPATARAIVGSDFIPRSERGLKKRVDDNHPANTALIRQLRRKNEIQG